jgi:hypothetical protein
MNANHLSIGRLGAAQTVATSTSVANSTAFGTQTRKVLIVAATAGIFIAIGAPGAATVAGGSLASTGFPLVVTCNPGETLSAIMSSGTGSVTVTELSA